MRRACYARELTIEEKRVRRPAHRGWLRTLPEASHGCGRSGPLRELGKDSSSSTPSSG
jgi:hypothetical protein